MLLFALRQFIFRKHGPGKMEKQLLIFDLDGTLIDSRSDLTTGVNLMRAHYGLAALSQDTVTGFIGDGARHLVARSLQGNEGTGVDINEAMSLTLRFYTEHMLDQTGFYPYVTEGLQALVAREHTLAVLSNKPGDLTRQLLKELKVADCFLKILGGGDFANLKPAPDGIYMLMEESGVLAPDCWMIGDHHTDIESAHNAGVKSGFVSYGIGHPDKFCADQIWHSFDELVNYFCFR